MRPEQRRRVVPYVCLNPLFSAANRRHFGRCVLRKILGRLLVIDRLLRWTRHARPDRFGRRAHYSEPVYLSAIGLVLIALGAGGIKPCVSTNVGDQFGETNKHLLPRLFNWFYFSINAGSALSTLLIPWLLEPGSIWDWLKNLLPAPVSNFLVSPRLHSPDVAFGLPGIFMAIATSFFGWVARNSFIFHRSVVGNFLTILSLGRDSFRSS